MALYLVKKLFQKNSNEEPEPCHHELAGAYLRDLQIKAPTNPTSQASLSQTRNPKTCTLCIQERKDARKYRWKLIIGILLPYLLASLDLTVVATALPFIASHFSMKDSPHD
jgi:hypothetical protein